MRQFEKSVEDFIPFFKREGIFAGIFSFGFEDGNIESDRIDEVLKGSKQIVDHICLGSDYFVKWWNRSEKPRLDQIESFPIPCDGDFYNIYNIKKLSYSYFISNLIERLCGDFSDRYWFAFPIEGTKERNRIKSICL
jgi:hypothetical protein